MYKNNNIILSYYIKVVILLKDIYLTTAKEVNPDSVLEFAEIVNQYGFMLVFSIIVLGLAVYFFFRREKQESKKSNSEMDILYQERYASIEQNKQMFDLVTNVQTEQVSQLQNMTKVLQDISLRVETSSEKINTTDANMQNVEKNILETSLQNDSIISTVAEILDYVKASSKCAIEILEKVTKLEEMIKESTNDDN